MRQVAGVVLTSSGQDGWRGGKAMGETGMQRDWRDSKAGALVRWGVFIIVMLPKPWLTSWQIVGVDVVLAPFFFWLLVPAVRRTIRRGPKMMGIVLAWLLVTGLWGTGANAGTLYVAYETAKSKAPCLTAEQRSVIRERVALKSFTLAAERYAKQHWSETSTVYDQRLYEPKAYAAIMHDAVQDYLIYARKVGRAVIAHSVNPAGESCYQAVVASLRSGGIMFENEDELSAYGPVEISQFDGGTYPGGHGWADAVGAGSLQVDRNFDYGPGPGCCIQPNDFLNLGGALFGLTSVIVGIEILQLPSIVQGINHPPIDLVTLAQGLIYIGKGFSDLKDAIERECGCNGDK